MITRAARAVGAVLATAGLFAVLAAADSGRTDEATADALLVPGPDGFLASWLVLGPIRAPRAAARSAAALADWDPLPAAALDPAPAEGARALGARWRASGAARTHQRFGGSRPGVVYLAARLRTGTARRVWLATGGDGGLEVWHDGRRVLRQNAERSGRADLDLIALDLPAGESALVLRSWRRGKGPWAVYARFMDEQYRRPRGLLIALPGAGGQAARLLRTGAVLQLERELDLPARAIGVRAWLEFPGGRPVREPVTARVEFAGPDAPPDATVAVDLGAGSLAFELLADARFAGERAPHTVKAELGGATNSARLGFRMRDVARLADAAADLERARAHAALPRTSVESVAWRVAHLGELITAGDEDHAYLGRELDATVELARELAAGADPYRDRRGGLQRRGYRSAVDGRLHHYAIYVPPAWREEGTERFGLVLALHGLNSFPVKTLQSLFGIPLDENETKVHRERHPEPPGAAPMFAVAPEAFGNSGYLAYGERDVLEVLERVTERYRIDPDRIYVTGASMGGIGAALVPLHHPGRFAAAAPLCGYHSLDEYRSLRGVTLRPWERFLADYRSNFRWAANGRDLPLYVVHGTRDNPRHSRPLVEAYRQLGFDVRFETPDLGHNVWDVTYADRQIFRHFKPYRRDAHPREVTLTTARLRYNKNRWLRIDDVADHAAWARVDARWGADGVVELTTANVTALTVLRDAQLAGVHAPRLALDGQPPLQGEDVEGAWSAHLVDGRWRLGRAPACAIPCKRPALAGPIFDVYNEPLLFVFGTADPDETAIARRVIERLRVPRGGTTVEWRVKGDVEVSAADLERHSLVIVGTPAGNSLLARIADRLPIGVADGAVVAGDRRFAGDTVAAAFVQPNPLNPERYVLVHTGVTAQALFYADHLPELLPDWVVYDAAGWGRAGGLVLGEREVLAAGFFDRSWRLAE